MRIRGMVALLAALLGGCALLRSRQHGEIEWSLLVFPGAAPAEREAAADRSPYFTIVASGCVSPDSLTFAAAVGCDSPATAVDHSIFVTSWAPGSGRYRADLARVLMQSPSARGLFAAGAAKLAAERGHRGIILDFPLMGPRDVDGLGEIVSAVRDSARAVGSMTTGIVVPAADTSAYPGRQFGAITDFVVIRLEQPAGTAGPLSPRALMTRFVGVRAGEIGSSRLVVAIPAFGRVRRDGEDPLRISHAEAYRTAAEWGVRLERDETSHSLVARHPRLGEIWVNDAVAIAGLVRDARRLGITRFALYGIGGEDAALWSDVLAPRSPQTISSSR